MRNIVNTYIDRFRHERRTQRRAAAVLLALAVVVAGGVFWQLHYTGVAMANETYCGYEEHTHDESCYETVLTCGMEEAEASEGHTHDASCYETVQTLTCGLEEDESHTHDDSCYTEEEVLICELAEEEAEEGHAHDESCYEEVLVCEIPEHVHTIECMSDETADVETARDWEATLPDSIPSDRNEAVAAVARSQVGYSESEKNFQLAEDGETRQGYTRYGAWYGNEYGDWDAMFVSFCLSYAGVPESRFPEASGAYAWITELRKIDRYAEAADCDPVPGDLVFFDSDEDGKADHVGIVGKTENSGNTVTRIQTVEGDVDDAVCECSYSADDASIVGYGILPQASDEEEEADSSAAQFRASDGGVDVTVTASEGALPEGAELTVELLDEKSDAYAEAAETVGADSAVFSAGEETTGSGMAVLDISFKVNGEEVEPSEPVQVTIDASALVPEEAGSVTVQHLVETGDGIVPEIVAEVSGEDPVAAFEVESFSAFTVTWTLSGGPAAGTTYSLSVTAYLDGEELNDIAGLTFDSENDELDFETLLSDVGYGTGDYTFSYAVVTVGNTTYGSQDNPVIAIEIDQGTGGPTASSNFLLVYADGSTGTVSTSSTVSVSAYYLTPDFSVSIEAVDEDESTEAWALQAVLNHPGDYASVIYEWTVTDGDGSTSQYAKVTNTDNTGRAIISWEEGTPDNTEVTVSVTVTLTMENGSTKTATADYVLEYGDETIDLIMTYGPDKTALPADVTVTLTSESGEHVYSGTTDSDGWVHDLEIEPGIYTVTATYTDSEGNTYQCSETVAMHDAGNYSINLNYYNETILTNVPDRSNWEHIDIKVSVGETGGADAGNVSVDITGCQIIGSDGTLKYTATKDTIEGNDNEFQLIFYEGDGSTGTADHSISFDTGDTITITYVLTIDGVEQDPVTIAITSSTIYDEGTTYPVTGQRAYKLYNYLYGTSYSSDAQLIADGVGDIDISGMSMMLVAAILCDSSEVTGAGQVQAVDGQSANQWGMDFALSIETLRELAASWSFDIEKTYENHSMNAGDFVFYLYNATVEDGRWSLGDLQSTLTNQTAGIDLDGNSTDTMEALSIAYSDEAIQSGETYYYILYEASDTIEEENATISYDGTVFGVMVQLGTDDEGEATVTATYYRMEESDEGYTIAETYTTGTNVDGKITFDENDYATFEFTNSYNTGVTLEKQNSGGTVLNGAAFTLTYTVGEDDNKITYYFDENVNNWTLLDEDENVKSFTLGTVTLGTPPTGSYTLTEISAPDGYTMLSQSIIFEVDEDHLIKESTVQFADGSSAEEYLTWDVTTLELVIINESSAQLPNTGGPGTILYTLLGLMLMGGAGGLLCRRKRGEVRA